MININMLKTGDSVLTVSDKFLAIKRKNGCVDIYKAYTTKANEFCIDPIATARIGYGDGTVEKQLDEYETTLLNY